MPEPNLLAPAPRDTPSVAPGRDPVPVTLLTGFLGAGKTTLLNRILTGDHGLRIGVLVNDFGAINIDAALVHSVQENTISLTNGCVCCEIRDDLVTSVEDLLGRAESIDYIILEASGIADPAGVVMTFLDARYEQLLRMDSIICLIDAEGLFRDGDDEQLTALKLRQIAFADLVVLNKTDLVGPAHIEVIRDWIGLHLKRIRIVETSHGDAPLEVLLGSGRFDPSRMPPEDAHTHQKAGPHVERWSYRTRARFSPDALQHMVKRELPASVYRCKGIIFTTDSDEPHALQVVGRRCDITPVELDRPLATGTSELVAIGRNIDGSELNRLFGECESSGRS
ncbi:MAG: GTP-binding protein [Mycobacterium sp.]|nr:GTP-binding protein [Mycobacterium sp.]